MGLAKKVDKPRALQHKVNLEESRIIMVSKRKEYRMIQTTIRIPKELHQKLKELAKKKGLTVNALIVQALWKLQEKKEVASMPVRNSIADRINETRIILKTALIRNNKVPKDIEKRKIMHANTFYVKQAKTDRLKLSDLWRLDDMLHFTDEEILKMFGRQEEGLNE